jgi:putative FmdB family regulatory protein
MPTYDYRCPNGHVFEVFQRMADPDPAGCAVCGSSPVERLLSPVAIHFKGSGFYTTDYGRSSRRDAKDGDGGSSKNGDSAGDAKTSRDKATASSSS